MSDTRSMTGLVEVEGLSVRYPGHRVGLFGGCAVVDAVKNVSFSIPPGTTLALVGESGSGKTTTARAILRLVEPVSGSVRLGGVEVFRASRRQLRRLRRHMQMVFQDSAGSLNPRMTVGRNVAEPLLIHRAARGRRLGGMVAELLDRVGLSVEDALRYPQELSGGQRQRVGIARAIALRPRFIVCDEPVSALDVSVQAQIINLLMDLQKELGLTYLFIAHNLAVVRQVADRVAVMRHGRMVELADAEDLYTRPSHPYTTALLRAVPEPPTIGAAELEPSASRAPGEVTP